MAKAIRNIVKIKDLKNLPVRIRTITNNKFFCGIPAIQNFLL
jgi:hypothetical protein